MGTVLLALLGPGVAQGFMRRKRAMLIFIGAFAVAFLATAFTIYATPLLLVVHLASFVDAAVYVKKHGNPRGDTITAVLAVGLTIAIALMARMFLVEAYKFPSSSMMPTLVIDDHIFINKLFKTPGRGDLIVFQQPCQPDRDYMKRVIALGNDTVEIRCNVVYVNGKAIPNQPIAADETYYDRFDEPGSEPIARKASRYRESHGGHTYDVYHDVERTTRTRGDTKDFPLDQLTNCSNQMDFESRPAMNQAPGKIVDTAPPSDGCGLFRHYVVPDGHVFMMGDNRNNSNDSRYWGSVPVANIKGRVTGIWWPVGRFGSVD